MATIGNESLLLQRESGMLRPHRVIGVVCGPQRASVTKVGSQTFITAVTHKSWQVYDTESLDIRYIQPIREETIAVWHKMIPIVTMTKDGHRGTVESLFLLGSTFLLSVGANGNEVLLWTLPSSLTKPGGEIDGPIRLNIGFELTAATHIPTYLNKMLIAGRGGELELRNLKTRRKIHTFGCLSNDSAITALSPSPALDVAAIGFQSGRICLINCRTDELLFTLSTTESRASGSITGLTFRTDNGDHNGVLISSTSDGDVFIWDLTEKLLHSSIKHAHDGSITTLTALSGEPLVVTTGVDNTMCVWIFDKPDGSLRLLRQRKGASEPIKHIEMYGNDPTNNAESNDLLITSGSRVGKISLIQQKQNKIWSMSNISKATAGLGSRMKWRRPTDGNGELGEIVSIAGTRIRQYDWPNVITANKGSTNATVWSGYQQALVNRQLDVPDNKSQVVKVAVSPCGNFACVGLKNGEVHRFNLQSCLYRGLVTKHENAGEVAILEFLSSTSILSASSTSRDLRITTFGSGMKSTPKLRSISLPEGNGTIQCAAVNGPLVAVALNKGEGVLVVDMDSGRVVRRMDELKGGVTAMGWSHSGQLLTVADSDAKMVIYDLPTASVVDRVIFTSPVMALCWSNGDAFLITSHPHTAKYGAMHIWTNTKLLGHDSDNNNGMLTVPKVYVPIDEPIREGDEEDRADDDDNVQEEPSAVLNKAVSYTPQSRGAITLSNVPRTSWQYALRLDEIKERNKPVAAPKKPESAPFFLPTVYDGSKPLFAPLQASKGEGDEKEEPEKKRMKFDDSVDFDSTLDSEFERDIAARDWEAAMEYLKKQTASGLHLCISEIRDDNLRYAVEYFEAMASTGKDYDLVQVQLSLFLKFHAETLLESTDEELRNAVKQLSNRLTSNFKGFDKDCSRLECLVRLLSGTQMYYLGDMSEGRPHSRGFNTTGGGLRQAPPPQGHVKVVDRPVTQQGLSAAGSMATGGGIRPGTGRQVLDKNYYKAQLRNKINELTLEITRFNTEMGHIAKEAQSYKQYEKRYHSLLAEVKALEGDLADYNLALDKQRVKVRPEEVERQYIDIKQRNAFAREQIDNIFLEKKECEEGIARLEYELNENQKHIEEQLTRLTDKQKEEYRKLMEEQDKINNASHELESTMGPMRQRLATTTERLHMDPSRRRMLALSKARDELFERKQELTEELEKISLPLPKQREMLIEKIKEENSEMVELERKYEEMKEALERFRRNAAEISAELNKGVGDSSQSEGDEQQQKYKLLFAKDAEMTTFLGEFPKLKEEESRKIRDLQSSIRQLTQRIHQALGKAKELPTRARFEEMQSDLSFKDRQVEASEATGQRLEVELQQRRQELDKISDLEHKVEEEIAQAEESMQTYQDEIDNRFSCIDELREARLRDMEILAERRQKLERSLPALRDTVASLQLKMDAKKQTLHDNSNHAALVHLENKLKHLEQTNYQLESSIQVKLMESDYQDENTEALEIVNKINEVAKKQAHISMPVGRAM
ncbi:WD repeat-containing protein 36 [Perkinsus chesapeaki]|uniref:WD repeat-containing protein 36 n=1 Tax=Perkinsus chesapeaki TaxID=330153 RepID=A0A7J6MMI3_PERCH|nr:WD repeat-containing protein 36 [Perkinsus chesapeaki]